MSFYKCTVCSTGTDLARQCGRGRCSHLESRCEAHGGDYEAIKAIQAHMKSHDASRLEPWGDRPARYNGNGEPCETTWVAPHEHGPVLDGV